MTRLNAAHLVMITRKRIISLVACTCGSVQCQWCIIFHQLLSGLEFLQHQDILHDGEWNTLCNCCEYVLIVISDLHISFRIPDPVYRD